MPRSTWQVDSNNPRRLLEGGFSRNTNLYVLYVIYSMLTYDI